MPPVCVGVVPKAEPSSRLQSDDISYGECPDCSLILLVPPARVGVVPKSEPSSRRRFDDISYGVCQDCGLILLMPKVCVGDVPEAAPSSRLRSDHISYDVFPICSFQFLQTLSHMPFHTLGFDYSQSLIIKDSWVSSMGVTHGDAF